MKTSRLIFLAFLSLGQANLSFAYEDNIHCEGTPQLKSIDTLEKFSKQMMKTVPLNWSAATPDMVSKRVCKKKLPTPAEVEADIDKIAAKGSRADKNINGISLSDESPALLEAFEDLTTVKNIYGKPLFNRDLQQKHSINPECKKVKCAMTKIFGKELGDKLLYMKLKYGFNSSELGFENSDRVKLSEMNDFISAVETFPASRFPLNRNQQLTKFTRGSTLSIHDKKTFAYAAIAFYDLWSKQNSEKREYTVFHEIGHNLAHELKLESNPDWLSLSGWEEKNGKWTATIPNSVPSNYGKTNPDEDFAESVTAYRYNPKLLMSINPKKYQFLKEVIFDGLEYIEPTQCSPEKSMMAQMSNDVLSFSTLREEPDALLEYCADKVKNYLFSKQNSSESLNTCFQNAQVNTAMKDRVYNFQPHLDFPELLISNLAIQKPEYNIPQSKFSNFNKTKNFLKQSMIDDIVDWEKKNNYNYTLNKGKNVCDKTWNKYSNQAFFKDNKKIRDSMKLYNSADEISKMALGLCNKIQNGKTDPRPLTREEVEKALELP